MCACEKATMGGGLIVASICTIISLVRVCSDEAGWDVHFLCAALTVWRIMWRSGNAWERWGPD
jgi:hypothetical protein